MGGFYLLVGAALVTAAAPAPQKAATADKTKMVCKAITLSGSRLPGERICMTKAEWELQAREGRKTGEEVVNNVPLPPRGN